MLLARCHLPGCLDTAGKRGFMCLTHWPMVPRLIAEAHWEACRAERAWERGLSSAPPTVNPIDTGSECIRAVLVLLWSHAFPNPEPCGGPEARHCGCPPCDQARGVARAAYLERRHVDSRERA